MAQTTPVPEPDGVPATCDRAFLDCERLDVYRVAVEFQQDAARIGSNRRIGANQRDQLGRASVSIVLCIAEGAGRRSIRDKARFYNMACGSASAATQHATDATEPREGQEQPTGATPAPRWRAHTSWGDVVDGFGSTAPLQPGEVGLAFATVTREHAGDAVLSLGGTVGGVWVNGAQVHGATNAPRIA